MQEQLALTNEGAAIARRYGIAIEGHPFAAEARKKCITASDLPKLMGLSKWGDLQTVIADKLGLTETATNYRMRRGNFMEGILLSEALMQMDHSGDLSRMKDSGKILITLGEFMRRSDAPFGASLDALFRVDGTEHKLVEFKTAMRRWHGEIPADYQMQAKGQLLTLDEAITADFFVEENGGDPAFVGSIELLDEEIDTILDLAEEAWSWVERGIVPERVAPPKAEHLPKVKNKIQTFEAPDVIRNGMRLIGEKKLEVQAAAAALEKVKTEYDEALKSVTEKLAYGGRYTYTIPGQKEPIVTLTKAQQAGRASLDKDLLLSAHRAAVDLAIQKVRETCGDEVADRIKTEILLAQGNAAALANKPGVPFDKYTVKVAGEAAEEE